jgi:hypothetical protein
MSGKVLAGVIAGAVVLVAAGIGAYFFLTSAKTSVETSPSPDTYQASGDLANEEEAEVLGSSEVSPSPLPSATPNVAANDQKRQSDLALYVAAYKATAKNGFYSVNPPAVNVTATDPTTGQLYAVAKTAPAALGQIQYKPGGQCTGPGKTPGATGTRYLALFVKLEASATPYCLDVK